MFATNIFGPVALTKALLPSMRAAGRGRIVVVSSQAVCAGCPRQRPIPRPRAQLERWAESMAGEIAPFGMGVTILVTGTYDTDIITDAGTTDSRDFNGPYARHHATMDKRGQARDEVWREVARTGSPPGSPRRSTATSPFARRPVGPDARMLSGHQPTSAERGDFTR